METEIKRSHKKDPSKEGLVIKLHDDFYRIDPDPHCWVLLKQGLMTKSTRWKNTDNIGEKVWRIVGYYPDIYRIVQKLIDLGCKDLQIDDVKQIALDTAKKLEQTLADLGIERKVRANSR